jgi:hypothetical protein
MLIKFPHTSLLTILKWKQGERRALQTTRLPRSRHHVIFDIPPAGDFDHEEQRPLTPTEHIQKFGPRLRTACGGYPVFIDAIALDNERHKTGFSHHPLTELLTRAQLANAIALPVTGLNRSSEYQEAVRRFVRTSQSWPICVRIEADHLDAPEFGTALQALLLRLDCPPTNVFLVLDFRSLAPLKNEAIDEFAAILGERIGELPFVHRWAGFAIALSSFPQAFKLKAGEGKAFPRIDIKVYEKLITNRVGLLRTPMFGDYGVDVSPVEKPQRRTPSAQIRYSTPDSHVIEKGTSVKKPYGYEAIRSVARALTARDDYYGASFGEGDQFFDHLSRGEGTTGNAATWRWASSDHHLNANFALINQAFGIAEPISQPEAESSAQRGLFDSTTGSPPLAPEEPADDRSGVPADESGESGKG